MWWAKITPPSPTANGLVACIEKTSKTSQKSLGSSIVYNTPSRDGACKDLRYEEKTLRDEGYRCPKCGSARLSMSSTVWRCIACDEVFRCVSGVPRLYIEDRLGGRDVFLRDFLYNGLFGRLYSFMWPFLVLPVRPLNIAWPYWIVYCAALTLSLGLIGLLIDLLLVGSGAWVATVFVLTALAAVILFFWRHHYLFNLLLLAIPTKVSLLYSKFRPVETFSNLHARIIEQLKQMPEKLKDSRRRHRQLQFALQAWLDEAKCRICWHRSFRDYAHARPRFHERQANSGRLGFRRRM